jgi:hypothetical protein
MGACVVSVAPVWESPALPVLIQLSAAGVRFRVVGEQVLLSPPDVLTPAARETLRTHQEDVRALIPLLMEVHLHERVMEFWRQFNAAPAPTIPAFLFRSPVPYVKGRCFSCGDALPTASFGRCQQCSLAWRLVCRLPIPPELAAAMDAAKVLS